MDLAPNRLISAGLVSQIAKLGWEVHYETQQSFLDIPYNPISSASLLSTTLSGYHGSSVQAREGSEIPTMTQRLPDPDVGRMKKPRLVSAVCERVAQAVRGNAEKGWLPLTLGGDHSLVSLGSMPGPKVVSEREWGLTFLTRRWVRLRVRSRNILMHASYG